MHGNMQALFYSGVDKEKFARGIYELCQSYSDGYTDAKQALQELIDEGILKGFASADEVIKVFNEA